MSGSNPLTSRRPQRPPASDAMTRHAKVWQHVRSMEPNVINQKSEQLDALLPVMGELAGNPDVTQKMVIKAAAQAAADVHIEPSEAVQFISAMPPDPVKLNGWLRTIYAANLSAQVHMKAAMLQQAQQTAQAPQQAAPSPLTAQPVVPTSMTPQEAPGA